MLLISDLDQVAPDQAATIRATARKCASAWEWPYWMALDYILTDVDKRMCKATGSTFVPNPISCRLYEQGRDKSI